MSTPGGYEDRTDLAATDHRGLEVLTQEECDAMIAETAIGRVAFVSRGRPLILPVTHKVFGNSVVFKTSHGEKLDAAGRHAPAAFEIDGWDAATQTGWSVIVQGTMSRVDDPDEVAQLDNLGLQAWAGPKFRAYWVRLRRDIVTGRRLR